MEKNEAKRHHYIPQFILRNFTDENDQLTYWDIKEEKLEKRNTRSVFMNWHMYRDEDNHKDDPTYIESSLSVFEKEIAELIKKKILYQSEIILTRKELESLRIFLSLLSFRSDSRMNQYKEKKFNQSTFEILAPFAPDGNFEDLWKREIEELSKCRAYNQIRESKVIDPIIKQDFLNDLEGQYMSFVDARGGDFLITDIYPTLEIFPLLPDVNIHLHFIFPLSNNRLLLLNNTMFRYDVQDPIINNMKCFSQIQGDMIIPPKNHYINGIINSDDDKYIYKVRKIYSDDVEYINALQLNEAKVGVAFKDGDRVIKSIESYNLRDDRKKEYENLAEQLNNK